MAKVITDEKHIREILDRGVVTTILPSKEAFIDRLRSGKPIRIYIGADPTSDSLHLSHAKNYMFLEELRALGHEVIVLVGDFTARIGDPTDRTSARKQLTKEEVKKNVKGWISQIKTLINFHDWRNPARIKYNGDWLSKLSFADVVELASNFTVQQMIERDMFQKRLRENAPIHLHEFFYPLMQGYDSVAMDVDAELCGTDQTFNALAGRTLMKRLKDKEKFVVTVNLMENPKTGELMSKSRGTGVFLSATTEDMYGQIMAQPDEMIRVLFVNCTRIPLQEVEEIMNDTPRNAKARAAFEIVKKIRGEKAAQKAQRTWEDTFSKKEIHADEIPTIRISEATSVLDMVMLAGVTESKSEARRLIAQGGVKLNDEPFADPLAAAGAKNGAILKIGKRHFFKIEVN